MQSLPRSSSSVWRRLRFLGLLSLLAMITQQGCRCCFSSFISSRASGTLIVTRGTTPTAIVQLTAQDLKVTFQVEACYGRVLLKRSVLVYESENPDLSRPLEERLVEQLRRGRFVPLPALKVPLDFERCSSESNTENATCFLRASPPPTEVTLDLSLDDPSKHPPSPTSAWEAPCQLVAAGQGNRVHLLLFAGFLEDQESTYTVPPIQGQFTLECR